MLPGADITFDVQKGEDGHAALPDWASRQIRRVLDMRAREGVTPTRLQIGNPARTRKQDRTYFKFLEWISAAYLDAGRVMPKDLLHLYFKALYLPVVKAETERETGEVLDIGPVYDFPDGTSQQQYSIKRLTKAAMAHYVNLIASDSDVVAMNVPVPTKELLGMENPHR